MTNDYYARRPNQRGVNGLGVAALCIGILAALFCWIPFCGLAAIPVAVVGGVLGFVGIIVAASGGRSGVGIPIAGFMICVLVVGASLFAPFIFIGALANSLPKTKTTPPQTIAPVQAPVETATPADTPPPLLLPVSSPDREAKREKAQSCLQAMLDATQTYEALQSSRDQAVKNSLAARRSMADYVGLSKQADVLRAEIDDAREHGVDVGDRAKTMLGYKSQMARMDDEAMNSAGVLAAATKARTAQDVMTKAKADLADANAAVLRD